VKASPRADCRANHRGLISPQDSGQKDPVPPRRNLGGLRSKVNGDRRIPSGLCPGDLLDHFCRGAFGEQGAATQEISRQHPAMCRPRGNSPSLSQHHLTCSLRPSEKNRNPGLVRRCSLPRPDACPVRAIASSLRDPGKFSTRSGQPDKKCRSRLPGFLFRSTAEARPQPGAREVDRFTVRWFFFAPPRFGNRCETAFDPLCATPRAFFFPFFFRGDRGTPRFMM